MFHAKRRPGPESSGTPSARDFRAIMNADTAKEMPAAASQMLSHIPGVDAPEASAAAPSATKPMPTPPNPDTWVNAADRSIVSRMYRRLSMARSRSATAGRSGCLSRLRAGEVMGERCAEWRRPSSTLHYRVACRNRGSDDAQRARQHRELQLAVAREADIAVELEARGCIELQAHASGVQDFHALGADVPASLREVEEPQTRERPGVGDATRVQVSVAHVGLRGDGEAPAEVAPVRHREHEVSAAASR